MLLEWDSSAQVERAVGCLVYLPFGEFKSGSCPSDESFPQKLAENQFLDYSVRHWSKHVRRVQESTLVSELAIVFCGDPFVDSVIQAAKVSVYKHDG